MLMLHKSFDLDYNNVGTQQLGGLKLFTLQYRDNSIISEHKLKYYKTPNEEQKREINANWVSQLDTN